MDRLASVTARAAGWREGSLGAVYEETEQGGAERLAAPDAVLAIVTLPFFLKHAGRFRLDPLLQIVTPAGPAEIWSLAAGRGRLKTPRDLEGWEITGIAGGSPAFVRAALAETWGPLPVSVRITFGAAPLSALRRAAAGDRVAVLLDGTQSAALPSLPFAPDLEIAARSRPMPVSLLCGAGGRLAREDARRLTRALLDPPRRPEDLDTLQSVRIARFIPCDRTALEAMRTASASASAR